MILIVDNYDSFTYNLYQLVDIAASGRFGEISVKRNDDPSLLSLPLSSLKAIIISPGPGRPEDTNLCPELIKKAQGILPILGVCLGHQLLGSLDGGNIVRAKSVLHGKTSLVHHRAEGLFEGLPSPFKAARYHSLCIEKDSLTNYTVTASTADGEIMAIAHRDFPSFGIQFHPESFLTEGGEILIGNFLAKL
ncbi:MAG: aminodeoxychorismate/anthranilate synthase component II [Candidatus Dadabacteria bacterium]|nr:MAG: aminodeoxychorismate/anthranilate synthase component II [Candidatus Dadabacteria bacterium]